jgi:hypothetical protein
MVAIFVLQENALTQIAVVALLPAHVIRAVVHYGVDVVEGALVDGPFLAVDVAKVLGEFVALEAEFAAQEPAMGKRVGVRAPFLS